MLSQTAQYALRTALELARHPLGQLVAARELATRVGVPGNYLSKILHQLARAGVVTGVRGKRGGFALARAADRIHLVDVVQPFQDVGERSCLLGRPACSDTRPCPAHGRWKAVADTVAALFAATTLAQLLTSPGTGATVKKPSVQAHDRLSRAR
jgi:Rrf2 family protein